MQGIIDATFHAIDATFQNLIELHTMMSRYCKPPAFALENCKCCLPEGRAPACQGWQRWGRGSARLIQCMAPTPSTWHNCISLSAGGQAAFVDQRGGIGNIPVPAELGPVRTHRGHPVGHGGDTQSPACHVGRADLHRAEVCRGSPSWGPGVLLQNLEPLGKQTLMSPCYIVGISLTGSLVCICSSEDKKPRVLWETGRPYLPSQAASPAMASSFFPLIPNTT